MSKDNKTTVLLVLAAVYFMSQRGAIGATIPRQTTPPMNSLPGNIGTGAGQVIGGALGGIIKGIFGNSSTNSGNLGMGGDNPYTLDGSGSSPAVPDWDAAWQTAPGATDDYTMYA
jgi:hypothetical protein